MADSLTELPDYMRIRDRPLGVSILGGLHLLGGLLMLAPLAMFVSNSERAEPALQQLGIPLWVFAGGLVLLSLLGLLSGVGMFLGKKWGWWLAAFYYVYSIARHGNALFLTYQLADEVSAGQQEVGHFRFKFGARIVVAVLLLLYLFRTPVLCYFGLESSGRRKLLGTLVIACFIIAVVVNVSIGMYAG